MGNSQETHAGMIRTTISVHCRCRRVLICVCAQLQICSPAEKKAIDKMIDSGPQLAGSMEYNVVLSEYYVSSYV